VADEHQFDVVPHERVRLGDQVVGGEPGEQPPVQLEVDLRRDHVHLLASTDDRRVDRVP
jgi:hypothetical protein